MIPFEGLLFFYILVLALIPAILLGLFEKSLKYYGMMVSLGVILLIFDTFEKKLYIVGFYLLQILLIQGYFRVRKYKKNRYVLWLFLVLSLLPLIIVKVDGVLLNRTIAFLGVSYLTFRVIQVLLETYDGLITYMGILELSYFIMFFPTLSSGPIDRSRRFLKDLDSKTSREEYLALLQSGVWRIFTGVLYNFVISTIIYSQWLSKIYGQGFLSNLNYMYAYTLFLFFNFAGYTQMAIGTSYILGIRTPDNFNMPFISRDLKEFWSRWHMTLSTWIRDYIYTRFVMNSLKNKWFKNKLTGSYIGYIITMMTMGFWHGLEIRYIIYGAYHGILMCLNDILDNKWKRFKSIKRNPKWQPLLIGITFNIVCFGLLIFSGKLF